MAFTPETFVLCSKFNLFKAHANLWIYTTGDTLEDCLVENYFQPRRNLKNQDSPNTGDIIQVLCEHTKLAYLKIIATTEKPYNITVARTFLENEADIIAMITELQLEKASKETDFVTPITDENLGITQTEQTELEEKIDLAANSGRMITQQGFWYAKMHSETVAPSAEDGTNYADFSQTDGQGNPIIVTYNRVNGAWVQDQTITPPADYDGYVPITSKIWDIDEQEGQQGGRILWNHTSKQFTPYPQIVSFDSIEITGDSTVEMPQVPTDDNIANVGFVKQTVGGARNIGDMFITKRTDAALNGSVECDGATYQTTDFTGAASIGALLALNKIPYISLSAYAAEITAKGWCDKFGWDGVGTTAFRVPTLTAYVWQNIQMGIKGSIGTSSVSDNGKYFVAQGSSFQQRTAPNVGSYNINVTTDQDIPGASVVTTDKTAQQRVMVQLAVSATDEALETCTGVLADVAALKYDYVVEFQAPTAENNYTWYRKYKSGWVEQGGIVNAPVTVTFPIEMANTYYYGNACPTDGGSSNYSATVQNRTTTGAEIRFYSEPRPTAWEIKGMAAQ